MNSTNFSYLRSVKKFDPSVIKGANRMIDKTAIEKICSLKRNAENDMPEYDYGWDAALDKAIEALAALEAEKPAEDAKITAEQFNLALVCAVEKGTNEQYIELARDIVAYTMSKTMHCLFMDEAAAYHAEQCTACARQNQWMPKSVLLPVNSKPVICIHNQDGPFIGFFDYDDDEWYDVENMIRDVTHWQPLPEAPRV